MKLQYVGPISPIFVPEHNEYLDIETGDVVEFTDTLGERLLQSSNWEKPRTKAAEAALQAVADGPQSYEDGLEQARLHAEWLANVQGTPTETDTTDPAPPADDSPDGE